MTKSTKYTQKILYNGDKAEFSKKRAYIIQNQSKTDMAYSQWFAW